MGFINLRRAARTFVAAVLTMSALLPVVPAQAASERALYLYYTHTKETARIVFKRNGQYVQSGLNELNQFLRDWRRNEPANMDPRLFDLVWEVYQDVGGSQPINVVSAYRSPATNAMLAKNSSGVADNSQHMRGTAMDFFIPGVPLTRLRAAAMKKQVGGVGYYPTSGSPFVHLDTGSVRAWPRMTRAQLKEIFPDGRTMHLPTDGTPLSREGYQVAMAEWKRCHAYPCNGSSSGTQVASSGGSGRTLMDVFFGGNGQQAAQPAPAPQVQTASLVPQQTRAQPQAQPQQQAAQVAPVMPVLRPADLGGAEYAVASVSDTQIPFSTAGSAPLTSDELGQATASVTLPVTMPADLRQNDAVTALAAFSAPTMPTPRVIMTDAPSDILTAYAAAPSPEPGAQRALEMIIQNNTTASVGAPPSPAARLQTLPPLTPTTQTASLGGDRLFSGTFGATDAAKTAPLAEALAQHVAARPADAGIRQPALVAPDLDHVADIFTDPAALTSNRYAVIFDHDVADFDPTPEMGRNGLIKGLAEADAIPVHNRFSRSAPLSQ